MANSLSYIDVSYTVMVSVSYYPTWNEDRDSIRVL